MRLLYSFDSCSTSELWALVVGTISDYLWNLKKSDIRTSCAFREVLDEVPPLAYDILMLETSSSSLEIVPPSIAIASDSTLRLAPVSR